jgi:thiol-disulfide isomerase/thioredoxin
MKMLAHPARTVFFAFAFLIASGPLTDARAGGDWNDAGIDWQSYEDGLAKAKETGRPVCLVFYTDWCPHCTKYSGVFHDEKVVEQVKEFVAIRVNKDEHTEISTKYAPDGEYIPRTYFLSSAGELDPDIHEQRDQYRYYYNTSDSGSVLRGMREALEKFGTKPVPEGPDT